VACKAAAKNEEHQKITPARSRRCECREQGSEKAGTAGLKATTGE
jgi:hypothetical protein